MSSIASRWLHRRTAVAGLVFAGCLGAYHLNGEAQPEVDCVAAPYAAWSLVRHGTFDLRPHAYLSRHVGGVIRVLPDGSWVSIYPPGSTLAALPFVAPVAAAREESLRPSAMRRLGKLVAAAYVAAAAVIFHSICRAMVPSAATIATLLFAFGTCLWSVASQSLWMHGPATFWVTLAMRLLLVTSDAPTPRRNAWAGAALGMAVLTRPTTALFLLATELAFLGSRRAKAAALLGVGAAAPLALLLLHNAVHFGDLLAGGYGGDALSWSTPWWLGTAGLVVAPSRGLLVYSPALILAPLGLRAAIGLAGKRALLLAWLAAGIATVLLYGKWRVWWGGWCFGPRFLCETMPIFCLIFALGYERLPAGILRRAAWGLVCLSMAIHFLGVFGRDPGWNERHDCGPDGRAFFSPVDTQIEAHAVHLAERVAGRREPRQGRP